jgi:hypothetical protein
MNDSTRMTVVRFGHFIVKRYSRPCFGCIRREGSSRGAVHDGPPIYGYCLGMGLFLTSFEYSILYPGPSFYEDLSYLDLKLIENC